MAQKRRDCCSQDRRRQEETLFVSHGLLVSGDDWRREKVQVVQFLG